MADVFKSIKDIPEIQEPEFDDSIYKNKSLKELDDLGFEGWHNVIINNLRNSAYDTPDAAIQAAEKRTDWTPKQKAYVRAYANQIFGVTPEQEAEDAAIRKAAAEQDRQVLERQQKRNAARILEDQDIPVESNEERLKEGGLVGRFTRAGHKVSDVTDNSLVVDGIYKIVANNNLGFDVFKGDQKVANDIGNQRNFVALLEKLGGK